MSLPRGCNPKKLSSNEAAWGNILSELDRKVDNHFSKLGFSVTLYNGNSCGCLFDCICNKKEFVAKIVWA